MSSFILSTCILLLNYCALIQGIDLIWEQCRWKVKLVPMTSMVTCTDDNMNEEIYEHISEDDSGYALQLRIDCDSEVISLEAMREFAANGGKPFVTLCYDHKLAATNHHVSEICKQMTAVLVDWNNCRDSPSYHTCDADLCDPIYIVPMYKNGTQTYVTDIGGFIDSGGFSTHLFYQQFILQVSQLDLSEYGVSNCQIVHHWLADAVFPIRIMSGALLDLVGIPVLSSCLLYSYNAFENNNFIDVHRVVNPDFTEKIECRCTGYWRNDFIFTAGALTDRIVLLTRSGIVEVFTNSSIGSQSHLGNVGVGKVKLSFRLCARDMLFSSHHEDVYNDYVLLIGECQQRNELFAAKLHADIPDATFNFRKLPTTNISPDFIKVVTAIPWGESFIALVLTVTQYVLYKCKDLQNNAHWVVMSTLPLQVPMARQFYNNIPLLLTTFTVDQYAVWKPLTLSGIYLTPGTSSYIFIWGSHIIYSFDHGENMYLFPGTGDHEIKVFTSSEHSLIAYLTDNQKVYGGEIASHTVRQIYPSLSWDIMFESNRKKSLPDDSHLLSIFFDVYNRLQFLIVPKVGSYREISRFEVPLEEILAHNAFVQDWTSRNKKRLPVVQQEDDLDIRDLCPFATVHYVIYNLKKYSRVLDITYGVPYVAVDGMVGLHHAASLQLYHQILRQLAKELAEYQADSYYEAGTTPLTEWTESTSKMQTALQYNFEREEGDMLIFYKAKDYYMETTVGWDTYLQLPHEIYLDHKQSFTFVVQLKPQRLGNLDEIHVFIVVSNSHILKTMTRRHASPFKQLLTYEITVYDTGNLKTQYPSGEHLVSVSTEISFWNSASKCFIRLGQALIDQSSSAVMVLLGCPPNLRLVYDVNTTANAVQRDSKRQVYLDCLYPEQDKPCMYFHAGFSPYFRVSDRTSYKSTLFKGNYTLTVVGGFHKDMEEVHMFTDEEIALYNNRLAKSSEYLIWGAVNPTARTKDGREIFNYKNNAMRWICQPKSPCGNVVPAAPRTPEYTFVIEFSNKGVDTNTNCDFTVRFTVKVHGLPIPSLSVGLVLVLLAMVVCCIHVYVFYALHKNNDWLLRAIQEMIRASLYGDTTSVTSSEADEKEIAEKVERAPHIPIYVRGAKDDIPPPHPEEEEVEDIGLSIQQLFADIKQPTAEELAAEKADVKPKTVKPKTPTPKTYRDSLDVKTHLMPRARDSLRVMPTPIRGREPPKPAPPSPKRLRPKAPPPPSKSPTRQRSQVSVGRSLTMPRASTVSMEPATPAHDLIFTLSDTGSVSSENRMDYSHKGSLPGHLNVRSLVQTTMNLSRQRQLDREKGVGVSFKQPASASSTDQRPRRSDLSVMSSLIDEDVSSEESEEERSSRDRKK